MDIKKNRPHVFPNTEVALVNTSMITLRGRAQMTCQEDSICDHHCYDSQQPGAIKLHLNYQTHCSNLTGRWVLFFFFLFSNLYSVANT